MSILVEKIEVDTPTHRCEKYCYTPPSLSAVNEKNLSDVLLSIYQENNQQIFV